MEVQMYFIDMLMSCLGLEKRDASRRGRVKWKKRPAPGSKKRPAPNKKPQPKGEVIQYLLNDWTTPDLIKPMAPPEPLAVPVYRVKSYQGGGFGAHSLQGQAASCYITVTNCLKYMTKHCDRPLNRWAGTNNLIVIPRAGKQLNAFYNRVSLQFFYEKNKMTKKMVFTADSSDIVAHELGHAILDSYRPDMWSVASLEVWSFHEAFADLTAMLNIMQYDEILEKALEQTNNNIRKNNVFSMLAEDIGKAIYSVARSGRNPNFLRSAINNFKYVNPGTLPKYAPHNKLAAECHSFGRIFLGAFYDILVTIYEMERKGGMSPIDALKHARDTLAKYVMKAILNAPLNSKFYKSVAKTMLWADWTSGKKYHEQIKNIFLRRNLITRELRMLNAPKCDNDDGIVRKGEIKLYKLCEHVIRAQSDDNPLYDLELEIPQEEVFLYDENKNIIDVISITQEDSISDAVDMISYLHENNLVDDTEETPFSIQDGKLVRTHFE
jgi:hypothetical protein